MERPERPSRHKSNPVKYPIRPSFSSDSDSELNESEAPVQIYYQASSEAASATAGPSTLVSSQQQDGQSSPDRPNSPMRVTPVPMTSPIPLRVSLSPIARPVAQENETRTEPVMDPIRRKRTAAALAASSAAASVIFNSVDSLCASSNRSVACPERSTVSPDRSGNRFQHTDFLIRPRSFCNIDCSNAMRQPVYKFKRPNGPIDLTPSTSNRDYQEMAANDIGEDEADGERGEPTGRKARICRLREHHSSLWSQLQLPARQNPSGPTPVVTTSFSLRDTLTTNLLSNYSLRESSTVPSSYSPRENSTLPSSINIRDTSTLPSSSNTAQTPYYNRNPAPPYVIPQRSDHASTSSSILRQFDEMCSSPVIRRRSRYLNNLRFLDRYNDNTPQTDAANTAPTPPTPRNNPSLTDDYCDLVGNFLFNYLPLNSSDNQRSPPERTRSAEPQSSSTADIINRHIDMVPDVISNEASSIMVDLNSYLDTPEARPTTGMFEMVADNEPMEQSNDDVIVVETPERPVSPDPYMVPSSRSPTPPPPPANTTRDKRNKSQSRCIGEVPMTLKDLNQSLVSLLECPVCLDHATPPIYQCCKGHILCQSCHPRLTTCPICRARLPGDRNSTMEKVAEKLMYPCKNTVTGCGLMLKLDDKQDHEEGCGFRHYACIVTSCHWKGYKPELVVHLQSNHPDKLISGASKEMLVPLSVPVGGSMFLAHHWIQSAHNEVFNVIFHVDLYKRIMKGCVIYIGSPERADKFKYLFELKQQVPPFRTMSYSRSTHADTLKPGQPLILNNDFNINIEMARLYRPEDCAAHHIPITVSILQDE